MEIVQQQPVDASPSALRERALGHETLEGERCIHQRGIVAGVASGAAEIQLNIVASDVLQLPREPR